MGGKKVDLTGKKFGRLTVVSKVNRECGKSLWLCKCECGNVVNVTANRLKSGNTRSCGCLKRDTTIKRNKTHNMSSSRLYVIWGGMIKRCKNKNAHNYKIYGGRGIEVCDLWLRFEPFMEWALSNGYENNLSIDRIDNNGNYCPENCRWVDKKTQNRNRRNNRIIVFNGVTATEAEWAEILGMPIQTLAYRLSRHPEEIALTMPYKKASKHEN